MTSTGQMNGLNWPWHYMQYWHNTATEICRRLQMSL